VRPQLSLTSDFIVAFPGETDKDFEQTMKLVDDMGFDGSFSFIYSPRPGTPAADFADQVPHATAQARLARLQASLDAQFRAHSERMIGTSERVLVTGRAARSESELAGRTETNRVVNFPGAGSLVGTYADVRITAAQPHSLRGELAAA
jgi:tRNA-2-methylthio-N6-dimethylallyladenosine synthase